MPQYLYQIKGKGESSSGSWGTWLFPPLWTDLIEAKDKKAAKQMIDDEYGRVFPLRVLSKDLATNEFLLVIKEIAEDDKHTKSLFVVNCCKQCGHEFKQIEKYQLGNKGGGKDFCCNECSKEHDKVNALTHFNAEAFTRLRLPVIYKITNTITGLSYIGKTNQVFTLRWYQHFYHGTGSKFHTAIRESKITDWLFEVIEVVEFPVEIKTNSDIADYVFRREMHHINLNDTIKNGYNSVNSKNELEEQDDVQGDLFEEQGLPIIG